jgi:D-sedoheptulose 7-phosphate isomerase
MLQRIPHVDAASWFDGYAGILSEVLGSVQATDRTGKTLAIDDVLRWSAESAQRAHAAGNKLIFVGNGGSATIASHMATDLSKNGRLRTLALNDGSMLTCLGNDYGFDHVFAKQIEFYGARGDLVVAISSSGKSPNILNAVGAARTLGCSVLTLSGFAPDNPLRGMGDVNLYLKSDLYGFVEIGHLVLCHAIVDYSMERDGRGAAGRQV